MKKTVLVLLIMFTSVILSACTKATEESTIEFGSYDFTDLENCIAALVDQDEETVCSTEDSSVYAGDYANFLLPYLLDDTEGVEISAYVHYYDSLGVTIRFSELPSSLQSDVLIMNQIIHKVNTDMQNITDSLGYNMIDLPQIFFRGISLTDDLLGASFAYSATMNNDDYYTNYRMITSDTVEDDLALALDRLENILDLSGTTISALTIENLEEGRIRIIMFHNDNTFHINSVDSVGVDVVRTDVESKFPDYTFTE